MVVTSSRVDVEESHFTMHVTVTIIVNISISPQNLEMELLSLLAFLLAAVGSQINARPHFSNKVSNSTQKSLSR